MQLEFITSPSFNFLTAFGEKFKIPVHNNKLVIPARLGVGEIRKIDVSPEFKVLIHRYRLKQGFLLKRTAPAQKHELISFIFNSNEEPVGLSSNGGSEIQFSKNNDFAIQIASSDLDSRIVFPANKEIYYVVVGITTGMLADLLGADNPNPIVQAMTKPGVGFLYYESMTREVQKILKHITDAQETNDLSKLYYRVKIQELLYLVFSKLLSRESTRQNPVSNVDVEKIMVVRTAILASMDIPPNLKQLGRLSGLGETKMKQLFKQIFGDSIYNYYQKARMEEAAHLLRHSGYTVSEAGYHLGFSNLSHFIRLFNKHYGQTPKKYTSAG